MTNLTISMLGPLQVARDGRPLVEGGGGKPWALLAFLAAEAERPHTRERLAALLWPDQPEGNARQSLRWALATLRRAIDDASAAPPFLLVSRESIQFNAASASQVDLLALRAGLAPGAGLAARRAAVELYRGHLLADLSLPACEPFEEWLRDTRAELQRQVSAALAELVAHAEAAGDAQALAAHAERWLAIEPWCEPAHRALMLAMLWRGQRSAALLQYEACRRRLADDLGIEPEPATQALYAEICAGAGAAPAPAGLAPAPAPRDRQHLIDRVSNFWIDGVLAPSLGGSDLIAVELRAASGPRHPAGPGAPWLVAGVAAAYDAFNGDLLIHGPPGCGKTTLLLDLARTLLARARADAEQPVPVIFSLGRWGAGRASLDEWLVEELRLRYQVPPRLGRSWVADEQILPLLDGLDEVDSSLRAGCVAAIGRFRAGRWPGGLVVCCRLPELAAPIGLSGGVEPQPLGPAQIDAFLAADEVGALRGLLAADPAWRELAARPLALALLARAASDPALCQMHPHGLAAAAQRQIFASYIQQMLSRPGGPDGAGRPAYRRGLAWLARAMIRHHETIVTLEGLQPSWLPRRWQRRLFAAGDQAMRGLFFGLVAGLDEGLRLSFAGAPGGLLAGLAAGPLIGLGLGGLSGLVAAARVDRPPGRLGRAAALSGLAGAVYGLTTWLFFGAAVGAGVGLAVGLIFLVLALLLGRPEAIAPVERLSWSAVAAWRRLPLGAQAGAGAGLIFGLVDGAPAGAAVGLAVAAAVTGGLGLTGAPLAAREAPGAGIAGSARTALRASLLIGGAAGLIFSLAVGLIAGLTGALDDRLLYGQPSAALVGLLNGIGPGLIGAAVGATFFGGLAWAQHGLLRMLLWRGGDAPLDLAAFLDNAVGLLLLRRVGDGYMFIHRLLMEHCAEEAGAGS